MRLSGVHLPLTTPFDDAGRVAPDRLRANIERYEAAGVSGYLVLGTTGEAILLEHAEKLTLLKAARAAIPAGRPLLAGVGQESTAATIRLAREAADCGVDLLLVLTPHYYKSQMGDAAQIAFFTAVADAAPLPVLLYDMPPCTGIVLSTEAVARLCQHPNIVGIKDSSGNLPHLKEVLSRVPSQFQVLCGNASAFQPGLAAGATGGILAAADVYPEPMLAIARAMAVGRTDEAAALHDHMLPASKLAVSDHGIAGVKTAMGLRGLHGGAVRGPLLPANAQAQRDLAESIQRLVAEGLLPRREL